MGITGEEFCFAGQFLQFFPANNDGVTFFPKSSCHHNRLGIGSHRCPFNGGFADGSTIGKKAGK
jgi:hypothetical protein